MAYPSDSNSTAHGLRGAASTAIFIGSTMKGTWSRSSRSTIALTLIDAPADADGWSSDQWVST